MVGGVDDLEETAQNKAVRRGAGGRGGRKDVAVVVVKSKSRFHRADLTTDRYTAGEDK